MNVPEMQDRLIFLISPPRSGSTLLQRMIGSHPQIFAPAEPHVITPLAHLGYYHTVEKAPYDYINAGESLRGYVDALPGREADYLDACRAYTDVLYGRRADQEGKRFLLEKTPAYALVLDFLVKLYPRAKYVVLTRHPMAIWSSFADSFFEGDYQAAHAHNRLLERYVPAIAAFLRDRPVPHVHVRYEQLVKDPETHLARVCEHLGIPFDKEMIEYGKHEHDERGRGDPIGVARHDRPVTQSVKKWAYEMATDPAKLAFARRIVDSLDEGDLAVWGFSKADLLAPVQEVDTSAKVETPKMSRFRFERLVVKTFRGVVRRGGLVRRLVERLRFYCDILLRE